MDKQMKAYLSTDQERAVVLGAILMRKHGEDGEFSPSAVTTDKDEANRFLDGEDIDFEGSPTIVVFENRDDPEGFEGFIMGTP